MRRVRHAAILFTSLYPPDKQERYLFDYTVEKHYALTSLVRLPVDALALARSGLIDVVCLITHNRATEAVADGILEAGVAIDELRPRIRAETRSLTDRMIHDAALRGVDPAQIAIVLDLPLHTIMSTLGRDGEPHRETGLVTAFRRPKAVTRPGGRR